MTFLKSDFICKIDRMGRTWKSTVLFLICDDCKIEFEKRSCPNIRQYALKERHFCSQSCAFSSRKPGGAIREKIEQTCLKRFGVTSPLSSVMCRTKGKQAHLEKYGVEHPMQRQETLLRTQTTCLERYGKTSFLATQENRDLLKTDALVQKRTDAIRSMDFVTRNKKRHATMKLRGSYKKSKREDAVYEALVELFGVENIERQVYTNSRWHVDFFIKSLQTYVQFDGVYWHGLDRPLEVITKFFSLRDVQIYKKYQTDREQDVWFKEKNLLLVRITDKKWKNDHDWIRTLVQSNFVCIEKLQACSQ